MSPSKESKLKKIDVVTTTKKKAKAKTSKGSVKKTKTNLHSNRQSESPQPSTSGLNAPNIDDCDSELTDDEADSTPCCVCGNTSPDAINLIYTLEIIQWGKCDKCSHWTHLKYCTPVRCLRRNSTFLCPHCEKES